MNQQVSETHAQMKNLSETWRSWRWQGIDRIHPWFIFAMLYCHMRYTINCPDAIDAHRYNPASSTWTALNASGSIPTPRTQFCVAGTPDGMLYLFGGSITGVGDEQIEICVSVRVRDMYIHEACRRAHGTYLICSPRP
jgi:hypothetical protein